MRDLKVVGLDVDGRHIICEDDVTGRTEKFRLRVDERLRAAVRGDAASAGQTEIELEVRSVLRPKEIQARIRAGASVEQLAEYSGADPSRIERFAHPCSWSGPVPPSWPPRPTRCSRTGPRC